jgi:ParB-like chromosome segregation protein Spo0J
MKQAQLMNLTVDQLVQQFTKVTLEQDKALLLDDFAEFNRLFAEMESIKDELSSRDGDQRRALLRLYDHPNTQVRLKAVKATLAVAPVLARQALQAIADSEEFPQAGEAGMSLVNLDRGIFKPR